MIQFRLTAIFGIKFIADVVVLIKFNVDIVVMGATMMRI